MEKLTPKTAVPAKSPAPAKGPRVNARGSVREQVVNKYKDAGFDVQVPPKTLMTFTALRGDTFHHVRVVGEQTGSDADFVQNAMSNNARPISAAVEKGRVTLKDTNAGGVVRLRKKEAAVTKPPPKTE